MNRVQFAAAICTSGHHSNLVRRRLLERILLLCLKQRYLRPTFRLQTPLMRLKLCNIVSTHRTPRIDHTPSTTYKSHPTLPLTPKSHQPLPPRPLHPETNINAPMQLIQLAPNNRQLAIEIYLIPQNLPRLGIRP